MFSQSIQLVGLLKALHTLTPVHSDTNSTFLGGKQSATLHLLCEDSLTYPPLSIARYSFTQLRELGHHGENENHQASKR